MINNMEIPIFTILVKKKKKKRTKTNFIECLLCGRECAKQGPCRGVFGIT